MSIPQSGIRLALPATLEHQLQAFRRRVWVIKTIEALCGALFGVLVAYLAVFRARPFCRYAAQPAFGDLLRRYRRLRPCARLSASLGVAASPL